LPEPDPLAESLGILRRLTRQSATSWPVSDLPRRVTLLEIWSETIETEIGLSPAEATQIMASLITAGHAIHDFGRRVYPGRPITNATPCGAVHGHPTGSPDMDLRKFAPKGKFFKVADLNGSHLVLTVNRVGTATLQNVEQPVVYFDETPQALVLKATNLERLIAALGPESDTWPGAQIILSPGTITINGQEQAMLVADAAPGEEPSTPPLRAANAAVAREKSRNNLDDLDDEVPF
jgi:hypothetical protein